MGLFINISWVYLLIFHGFIYQYFMGLFISISWVYLLIFHGFIY